MESIIMYGSGGMAREIFDHHYTYKGNNLFEFAGYICSHGPDIIFERQTSLRFLGTDSSADFSGKKVLVCVGDPEERRTVCQKILSLGGILASYIHPTAIISKSAVLGPGCIFYPFSVAAANCRVSCGVVANSYSGIGHDVTVGDYTTLSAHVDLAGHAMIGSSVFLGSGARVLPKKKVGNGCKIGAGIAVIRSLNENSTVPPTPNKIWSTKN
jgi:sugar O-acyltransferase (sialic acid O-acetyltransferase NeuD family)